MSTVFTYEDGYDDGYEVGFEDAIRRFSDQSNQPKGQDSMSMDIRKINIGALT